MTAKQEAKADYLINQLYANLTPPQQKKLLQLIDLINRDK